MSGLMRRQDSVQDQSDDSIWIDQFLEEKDVDLLRYLRIMWKRKWLVSAVLATVVGIAALWTFSATPLYRSSVKIQIDPEEKVLPYQQVLDLVTNPRHLQTQTEILTSRMLSERVSRALQSKDGVTRPPFIGSYLKVDVVPNTQVVKVSYTSEDPTFSADAANLVAEEYIRYNFESRYNATLEARNFLQRELFEVKKKLEKSEEELARYSESHDLHTVSEEDNAVVQKLFALNQELTEVEQRLRANRYDDIRNSTSATFPDSLKRETVKQLEMRLSDARQKLAALSVEFGPNWPEVKQLRQDIANLERDLEAEVEKTVDQQRLEYQLDEEHRRRVNASIAAHERLVNRLRSDLIQYNIIKREVDTDKELYEGLLQRLKEAGVSAGLKSNNIRVIEQARIPQVPYSPNKLLNLILAVVAGLVLGFGLALFAEHVDASLNSLEDVEQYVGLPSLASIPVLRLAPDNDPRFMTMEALEAVSANSFIGEDAGQQESYRALRTSILLSCAGRPPQTILVTSSLPGEGKTTTALNLSASLAQTGRSAVLVELDLRRGSASRILKPDGTCGMSGYLSGHCELADVVENTGVPNLYLMPAGAPPPNPAELVGSKRMELALETLARSFDYVVLDSPPVLSFTDAVVVSTLVDGVVFVVQGGKTSRSAAQQAKKQLAIVGAHVLGTVMNRVKGLSSGCYAYYPEPDAYQKRTWHG